MKPRPHSSRRAGRPAAGAALAPALLALLLTGATLKAQAPQQPRIRVEVNLVSLIASVLNPDGRPVPNLPSEAFEIYEEGRKQELSVFEPETSLPLDLVLMVDTSASTFKELAFEKEAAARFIRQVLRPGDRIAVYEFDDTVAQVADFSANVGELQAAVREVTLGSGTALYDAVYLGARALERRPPGRRRVILLVTDAGETTSRVNFEDARNAALRAEAMLYTILVRPVKSESGRNTAGEHALLTISDSSGGAMYTADAVEQFEPVFDRIDRELRTQYRLGYYPVPRPPARSYRRIELRVKLPDAAAEGHTVRYRKGYFTAGAPE
jgi:Ca-activated chloride channel family protein